MNDKITTILEEFKVNEFLNLRLEQKENKRPITFIYVAGTQFRPCKYLLLTINPDDAEGLKNIDSIDEAIERLDKSHEKRYLRSDENIARFPDPREEFWGHCSNLQAWFEHDYDTKILQSSFSFPLLKELSEAGDPLAKNAFNEEISRRFTSNYVPVMKFLLENQYLSYLDTGEKKMLISTLDLSVFNELPLMESIELLKGVLAIHDNEKVNRLLKKKIVFFHFSLYSFLILE